MQHHSMNFPKDRLRIPEVSFAGNGASFYLGGRQVPKYPGPDPASVLPMIIVPTETDVICGRESFAISHPGTLRFRELLRKEYLPNYKRHSGDKAGTMQYNKSVTTALLEDHRIRFLKQNKAGAWYEVTARHVRDKVGHALRDLDAREEDCIRERHRRAREARERRMQKAKEAGLAAGFMKPSTKHKQQRRKNEEGEELPPSEKTIDWHDDRLPVVDFAEF